MPIVTDKQAIINLVQPLAPTQTIEAVALISTEPTVGGVAKAAVNSGVVGGLLSSIGLGRVTQSATQAINNTEGSAVPRQFYLVATNSQIVFFNADVLEPPRITYQMPYADIASSDLAAGVPGTAQIVFNLKTGKTYKYFGGSDTISEVAQAVQGHLENPTLPPVQN